MSKQPKPKTPEDLYMPNLLLFVAFIMLIWVGLWMFLHL